MKLLTKVLRAKLLANGANPDQDHKPVVKLFTPWANATWLLSELDPSEPDRAFGLCDLGQGYPELGYVMISEIQNWQGPFGLKVERDRHIRFDEPMSYYATKANDRGFIG